MTRVFISDAKPEERSALRLLLLDLKMQVVGEAADWFTTLTHAPATRLDMLLVEWDLLPINDGAQALAELRVACPKAIIVVLISQLDARNQAAQSIGADIFISRGKHLSVWPNICEPSLQVFQKCHLADEKRLEKSRRNFI